MFITFEGIDGSGKSTQSQLLADRLRSAGRPVELFRDPGATPLGRHVRETLLHGCLPMCAMAEMLMFNASRAQMLVELVRPALAAGKIVVADRYTMSTVVYQGHGSGLPPHVVQKVCDLVIGDVKPDLTIVFDIPVEKALSRCKGGSDRIERRGPEYFDRLRAGYKTEAFQAIKSSSRTRTVWLPVENCRPESIAEFVWEQVEPMLAPAIAATA